MMTPRVADISHHNIVTDLKASAAAGLWGVIHKASQGRAYRDPDYAGRRALAKDAGLLWGAYHFNTGDTVADQVEHFLNTARPDDDTLMVLDFEDNRLSNMSMAQAVEFLELVDRRLGRPVAIYSGNRLKEMLSHVSLAEQAFVTSHRLWLCQYGQRAVLPPGFTSWWLWQYTGDGVGPSPHGIAGIKGAGIDLNAFAGSRDELAASWAPRAGTAAPPASLVKRGTVLASGLNLREAANTQSAVVEVLAKDSVVEIVGETMTGTTQWLSVKAPSGKSGWVAARFVAVV